MCGSTFQFQLFSIIICPSCMLFMKESALEGLVWLTLFYLKKQDVEKSDWQRQTNGEFITNNHAIAWCIHWQGKNRIIAIFISVWQFGVLSEPLGFVAIQAKTMPLAKWDSLSKINENILKIYCSHFPKLYVVHCFFTHIKVHTMKIFDHYSICCVIIC